MIRLIKFVFLAAVAVCLVVLALANRGAVTLQLLPSEVMVWTGLSLPPLQLPLFVVIFGGVVAGLLIGFVWEYLREARIRAEASRDRRARTELEREVETLKGQSADSSDDVLALLDDGRRAS